MLAAVLLSTCIWASPSYFADLLYHRTEAPLVSVMATLMLGLPALYIVHMQGTLLTATGHIATFIRISLAAALVSILLKVSLLPAFGAQASAWVCICVYWAYAVALVQGTRLKLSSGIEWTEVLLYAMSALGCYGILRLLLYSGWNPLLAATFSCVASALVFAGVGGVKFREIWGLLKGK
jgi:O-antigen/teichoic acid export membrane protein